MHTDSAYVARAVQFCGIHVLIIYLNRLRELQLFVSLGIISQMFGAKWESELRPYFAECGILERSALLFYIFFFTQKNSVTNDDDKLLRALYIAIYCKFLWCILTDPQSSFVTSINLSVNISVMAHPWAIAKL